MLDYLISAVVGIMLGIFTGLAPGIHINLVSALIVSLSPLLLSYVSVMHLAAAIVAMGVTHTFLDSIPSVFLGAPDEEKALSVLPGHQLLLQGLGYHAVRLLVIGSIFGLLAGVAMLPFFIWLFPKAYAVVQPYVGWILLAVAVFIVLRQEGFLKKILAAIVIVVAGVMGFVAFDSVREPLFPMLSGLFGISSLLLSLNRKVQVPLQRNDEKVFVPKIESAFAIFGGSIAGSLITLLPSTGPSVAATVFSTFVTRLRSYSFLVFIGAVGTVDFISSMTALYTIGKARSGAIAAVEALTGSINANSMFLLVAVALLAGAVSTIITLHLAKKFAQLLPRMNYAAVAVAVISFISVLAFWISGLRGIILLATASFLGLIPPLAGFSRTTLMGCLMVPVIVWYLV